MQLAFERNNKELASRKPDDKRERVRIPAFTLLPEHQLRQLCIHIDSVVIAKMFPRTPHEMKLDAIGFGDVFERNSLVYKSVETDGTSVVFVKDFGEGLAGKRKRKRAAAQDADALAEAAAAAVVDTGAGVFGPSYEAEAEAHEHADEADEGAAAAEENDAAERDDAEEREEECGDGPRVLAVGAHAVGVDPGRRRIVCVSHTNDYSAEGIARASIRKFTRQEWQHYTGSRRAEEWSQRRLDRNPDVAAFQNRLAQFELDAAQPHSSASFERYMQKLRMYGERVVVEGVERTYVELLWNHYGARRIARHRFRAYRQKQSAVMRVVHTIVPKGQRKTTEVSYGDASFGPTGKHERAVPTTIHRKKLEHHCKKVVNTCEFRTSLLCCRCHSVLEAPSLPPEHLRRADGSIPSNERYRPHGLRICNSDQCKRERRVSRDGNSARSLLHLYIWGRAEIFRRGTPLLQQGAPAANNNNLGPVLPRGDVGVPTIGPAGP